MKHVLLASTLVLFGCGRSGLFSFDTPQVQTLTKDAGTTVVEDDKSCPADPFGAIGKACPTEGVGCGTCSPSPCDWCNLIHCSGHKWQNVEVFPAPPGYCDFGCGTGACDKFKEVCVEHFSRDQPCAVQFSCEPLPKSCPLCEALDGGGQQLIAGCKS
jgi:hypothetical protein